MTFFPKTTTSREEFINWIMYICEVQDIDEEKRKEWVKHVINAIHDGHYFCGMIFVIELSPHLLIHELFHHIFQLIRNLTKSSNFTLDYIVDAIECYTTH